MTDWLPFAVRLFLYIDLMALFGLAAFAMQLPQEPLLDWTTVFPLRLPFTVLACLGVPLSIFGLVVLAAGMSDKPLSAVSASTIESVLMATATGKAWLVRVTALGLIVVAAAASSLPRRRLNIITVFAGGSALATLTWSGHGAMDDGLVGMVHLSGDVLHLLAAANWLGALIVLGLLLCRAEDGVAHLRRTHHALARFSSQGTVLVMVILLTGILNGWLLVGPSNLALLPRSLYGRLLLVKITVFGLMLVIAAANRYWLTPALARQIEVTDGVAARNLLRVSLALETASSIVILGIVAVLGTLPTPLSDG